MCSTGSPNVSHSRAGAFKELQSCPQVSVVGLSQRKSLHWEVELRDYLQRIMNFSLKWNEHSWSRLVISTVITFFVHVIVFWIFLSNSTNLCKN